MSVPHQQVRSGLAGSRPGHVLWLGLTAVAYNVTHHLGLLPDGLGSAGRGTRVADWLDLAVPPLVLVPALLALRAARADMRAWVVFAVGAWLYTSGHGIHLAANSIGNVAPGDTAYFWDETAGHLIWYAGVALVVIALARTLVPGRPGAVAFVLAGGSGVTWGTNGLGADLAAVAMIPALAAFGWGLVRRHAQGVLLAVGGGAAMATLLIGSVIA